MFCRFFEKKIHVKQLVKNKLRISGRSDHASR